MGTCGCGDTEIGEGIYVPGTRFTIGVQNHPGCHYCDTGLMVILHFFDRKGWGEWADPDILVSEIVPDEYGGNGGHAFAVPVVGVEDLVWASQNVDELKVNLEDYDGLEGLLEEIGFSLLQHAFWHRQDKVERVRRSHPEEEE